MVDDERPLFAFVDTNTLLHFRPPRDLDWCGHLSASAVVLVVSPVVTTELQEIKDGKGSNGRTLRMQQRAQQVMKLIERELFPDAATPSPAVKLRTGVSWVYHHQRVPEDIYESYLLDWRRGDAQLVAATLHAQTEGRRVCVVTNDFGARLLAKAHGLSALAPSANWAITDEPHPTERENAALKTRLRELEDSRPKLKLKLPTDLRHILHPPRADVLADIDEAISELRKQFPRLSLAAPSSADATAPHQQGHAARIAEYDLQIPWFHQAIKPVLPLLVRHQDEVDRRALIVGIVLSNDGTVPAERVKVTLAVPASLRLTTWGPESVQIPIPPRDPDSKKPHRQGTRPYRDPRLPDLSITRFWSEATNHAWGEFDVVRHDDQHALPALAVVLPTFDAAPEEIEVRVRVQAYNHETITDTFRLKIVRSSDIPPRPPLADIWKREANDR
ncbi:MAG: hypothetical protein HOW73_18220 [Polyangiaceae bacterium]|nr:hypothetical protein [Polyangiaceae bacterium]